MSGRQIARFFNQNPDLAERYAGDEFWERRAVAARYLSQQRLLQMLDYVGVDYPPTVENGEVVDPVEYAEMEEFSGEIINLLQK